MPEKSVGAMPQGEDEKADVEESDGVAIDAAVAAAVAAKLAGSNAEVARQTSVFLKTQSRLLGIQGSRCKSIADK